jgi:dTDP-4-amino-4,6-dideoxygalactose transaminase
MATGRSRIVYLEVALTFRFTSVVPAEAVTSAGLDWIEQSRPDITDVELDLVSEALASGKLGGGGTFSDRAVRELVAALGALDVVLTTSGTDALELAAMLLDVGPGDTVILPSFTFASVATAFARSGARIRFADIEPVTLGIDPESVAELLDSSVRAVVPVHYAGVACDLPGLLKVLAVHENATLVEDNAHGLFGTLDGQALGTFGPIGATSFHTTKNLVTGEGGALMINDPSLVDRAHVLADKGTDRKAFLAGLVDKYTWRDTGSSFIMAEPLAAILVGQLRRRDEIHSSRARLYRRFLELLQPAAGEGSYLLPGERSGCDPVRHLFYVLLPSEVVRDSVASYLRENRIAASFHYVPLHSAPAASRFVDRETECPIAEEISRRILRLPLHSGLTIEQVERVADSFLEAVGRFV